MIDLRRPWLVGLALLAVSGPANAAGAGACDALTSQFDVRQASLEPPQVSAALFAAADDGCDALAKRLLDGGASTAARDRTGGTALTHAARGGYESTVRLLVAHGADMNLRTVRGETPLFVAAEKDRYKAAKALIDLGADIGIPGRAGVSPLAAAAYNGDLRLVDLLVKHGADPAFTDFSGKVAIVYAAARGFAPVVTRLLATGIDVNAVYGHKLTLLMWAAGYANDVPVDDGMRLVGMLIDKGAGLEARDDRGRTAMMVAAELGHDEIVDLLLKRGAKADDRDTAGQTAADLAPTEALKARLTRQ